MVRAQKLLSSYTYQLSRNTLIDQIFVSKILCQCRICCVATKQSVESNGAEICNLNDKIGMISITECGPPYSEIEWKIRFRPRVDEVYTWSMQFIDEQSTRIIHMPYLFELRCF